MGQAPDSCLQAKPARPGIPACKTEIPQRYDYTLPRPRQRACTAYGWGARAQTVTHLKMASQAQQSLPRATYRAAVQWHPITSAV